MTLTKLFTDFFKSERTGGFILIGCTLISLLLTNSPWGPYYVHFWHTPVLGHELSHWINDGLMAVFFLLIGLELEREVYIGEMSTLKQALLPTISALGGVLVPALIYLIYNFDTPGAPGAGIPMATDIAFAIGMLSLLGKNVPPALKVFLTALAVIDDLCAILVIAFFYTDSLSLYHLLLSLSIFGGLLILNRLKVYTLWPYLIGGVFMWYFMLQSGVHATLSGVLLAFAIPFGKGDEASISYKLQHVLHVPVAFLIVPLFALANTCILIGPDWTEGPMSTIGLGIISGLVIGKPVGITLFSAAATAMGLCRLPVGIRWKHITGVAMLAGIGFTMSIFITLLAFDDARLIDGAKISIIIASTLSALGGLLILRLILKK